MRPYLKIAQLVVFIIILHSVFIGIYFYNKTQDDLTSAKPDYIITADALGKEFSSNETVADTKYTGKTVELTGQIGSIVVRDDMVISILLNTSEQNSSVICNLAQPAAQDVLKTSQHIRIRGEVSGYLMDILLNNCVVVR